MGDLTVEGARYFKESRTRAFWKTPKDDVLQFDQIQRDLMGMNENPDRKVQAVLRAGKTPESSDVYLKQEDRFPLHLGLSLDNQGTKLTGKDRGGLTLRDSNLLGLDDQLFATTVFGEDFGTAFIRHELPVSTTGTRLVTHYSYSQVNPKKEFEPLGINSISQTYGVEIRQWFLRTLTTALEGYIGIDAKEKRTRVLSETTTRDSLRVLSLGGDFRSQDPSGRWTLQQSVSIGLDVGIESTALMSRQANPSFFKYGFLAQRVQQLFWNTKGIVTVQGQLSPDKLTPGEQFFLGGANSVRGYPESDTGADEAILGNFEYWIPVFSKTHVIPFLDYGYDSLNDPLLNEESSQELLGAGVGIHIQLQENTSLRFEWGFPLGDRPLTEGGHSQFHWRVQCDF
jgi:hemolysin activation/secretion protein